MTAQQDRIRYITEHYEQLQGLRVLPLSVPFVVAAWWNLLPSTKPTAISARTVELILAAVAVVASFPIRAYYRRRFGRVPALPWRSGVLPLVGYAALLILAEVIREVAAWQLPVPLVVLAILLVRLGLQAGGLRQHYVWIACGCFVFMALGQWRVPPNVRAMELDLLMAGGLVTAAIGDDRVLRRALTGWYAT
jgi:hypothetical protein